MQTGGFGSVLSQEKGGKVRSIGYASCGVRSTEYNMNNYSSMCPLKWAIAEKLLFLGHKWAVYK